MCRTRGLIFVALDDVDPDASNAVEGKYEQKKKNSLDARCSASDVLRPTSQAVYTPYWTASIAWRCIRR